MAKGPVRYELVDGIGILTRDDLPHRNALSSDVLESLKTHLDHIGGDSVVRVVVLRSVGPVFSSGHDLRELVDGDKESYTCVLDLCTQVMEAIRLLPQPVIAQVQGLATAAGCQLVASCDLAVASETASFATPGVQIGLFCTTPGVAVSRAIMPKKAMEMLLTGAPISAQEALEFGLISGVAPPEELEEQVMTLARHIGAASATTLTMGKRAGGLPAGPAGYGRQSSEAGRPRGDHGFPGEAPAKVGRPLVTPARATSPIEG